MGAGLIVAGVFCSVIYGVNILYLILAAAGVVIFGLLPWLLFIYLPGSHDRSSGSAARAGGWGHKPGPRKEPAGDPVGPAEKLVQDLEDPEPGKPARAKAAGWLPGKGPGLRWIRRPAGSRRVFRIPGFRQFKRVTAFFCMILNFAFGEFALTAPGNAWFSVFFLASSFLLADYLWKTRKKSGMPEE